MKVAVVTESFLPQVNGVTRSVLHTLEHLRRGGHEALVLTPGEPPTRSHGFEVVGLPSLAMPGYPQVRVCMATPGRLARELDRFEPDVVHLASPFMVGGSLMRAANDRGIPVVAIYQTDVAGFAARYGLSAAGRAAWRRIRLIHERAELTLAPTPTVAAQLSEHGIPRVQVWPRGVDTAAFSPRHRDEAWRARVGRLRGGGRADVLVGFVGRLAPEKQVEDLGVLAGVPGVRVVVIGDGPSRGELADRMPEAHFTGALTGGELSRAVASLDLLAHPCPHETYCQAAQEAMACAVPVVAVGAGGLLDLVDHGRTGWHYRPGDLGDLHSRVTDLAGDGAKRRTMGQAALESVRGRTWPVVCGALMDHYERAIDSSRSRALHA